MTTNDKETSTVLRMPPAAEQLVTTRGNTVQDEAARANRVTETANSPQELSNFFSPSQAEAFQARWNDIQVGFVDDPAGAVEQATALVSDVIDHLTQGFTAQRQKLD